MSAPKLVIFDCDGTLVDSQHVIVAAMEMAFSGAGLARPARESVLSIVGLSLPQAIAQVKAAHEIPHDEVLLDRILEGYKDAFNTLRRAPGHEEPMFPGALDGVLQLAARKDVLLGIATGKSRRGVDRFLETRGLEGRFATIQTADDAPSKPHPAMIEQAMAEAGADARDTVMIGDTSFDMAMAVNAGVRALGVAWGYHPVDALAQAGAEAIAEDFASLLAMIDAGAPDKAA